MMRISRHTILFLVLALFILVCVVVWSAVFREDRHGLLRVSFLDIGQGDSIFIESPTGRQILIDGGSGAVVLRRLSEVMPWYDRSIDVVIATHPDQDHIGGLPDVLKRYRVQTLIHSSVEDTTGVDEQALERAEGVAARKGTHILVGQRGQVITLGGGAYFEILSPDRPVPRIETNTGCIVGRLVFGDTAFMLSCDAPKEIENYLVALDGTMLHANVLKAGHHGSKNSSSDMFLGFVNPEYGVYSRGCHNSYGHPNQETIAVFNRFKIPTFDTCTEGTITFVSDGKTVTKR